MLERWRSLCERIGQSPRPELTYEILQALYSFPPRAYHSISHVADCLSKFDELATSAQAPDAVEFAIWIHDCIYHATRKDNEERSAAIGEMILRDSHASPDISTTVSKLVLATKHTGEPLSGDSALLTDIDMAVLARPEAGYREYAEAIRTEYAFAPEEQYRAGRRAFLTSLLERPTIYHTRLGQTTWEANARQNIQSEIRWLSA